MQKVRYMISATKGLREKKKSAHTMVDNAEQFGNLSYLDQLYAACLAANAAIDQIRVSATLAAST